MSKNGKLVMRNRSDNGEERSWKLCLSLLLFLSLSLSLSLRQLEDFALHSKRGRDGGLQSEGEREIERKGGKAREMEDNIVGGCESSTTSCRRVLVHPGIQTTTLNLPANTQRHSGR